jgi:TP901 family phage tail tape measure protein
MAIINGVSDAFKAMVKNVVEVEKALADINVVMGLSATNLDKFSSGLFKVAKETAASFDVAAAAATEYARQGLKVEETLKRTKDALILTRLTGMDSANAVKALTAAMNTYGDQIKDTTQLVSKFAAVDVQFAVSAEDFADAISRTGQAAKSAGVDIDELVGLVTAAQQQTARGGKVIGNSFKTIFTRIGRTDTLNQLENLGIAVRDVEGRTLGAKRILTDLANTFDHLSEAQKAQIAQTVGGVFQINVLKAVLSDAAKQNGILANATQISAGATDEAITKNEQLRQTMAAMASETGLALKEVSAQIGEIMLAPGMEKILNIVKSMTEGVGDMLGTGEGAGNTFAKGFLKGLGNIITGPGLVVMVAVFTKLLIKAVQYARDSLKSLIGVTSEAQKQKAIQTSLVTLFGQNAALNKEMLRTDISRTEKEKIILSLLKAQVMEANALNSLTKQMSTTLYSKGYGANLAPRRGKAGGHIPNFADPERQQAARGGYAAGSIRSMNMPGEGSVIYNSAEKVKNFKGMTQPAIMPPHSSKAGKNYQQAFGSIHGFDPYAARGYIPNFASAQEIGSKNAKKAGKVLNSDGGIILLTANYPGKDLTSPTFWVRDAAKGEAGAGTRVHQNVGTMQTSLKNKTFSGKKLTAKGRKPGGAAIDASGVTMRQVKVPTYSLDKSDSKINLPKNKDFQKYSYDKLKRYGKNLTIDMVNRLMPGQKISNFKGNKNAIEDNDVAVMGGRIFEKVLEAITQEIEGLSGGHKGALLDVPANPKLFEVFGAKLPAGKIGAEAKISSDTTHMKSAARKIFDVLSGTKEADILSKAFPSKKTFSKTSDIKNKAYGHIPNFADPLSDAIGREKEAGVPVSQIRVGSHPALMNKSNPIGLGVTNTQDEPNGLRDVFGAANGFVPNYVNPFGFVKDKIVQTNFAKQMTLGASNLEDFNKKLKKHKQEQQKHSTAVSRIEKQLQRNLLSQKEVDRLNKQLATAKKHEAAASRRITSTTRGTGVGGFLGRSSARMGGAFSGNSGMMMMMGAPMAAGFLQQGGMGAQGGNQGMYAAGGALSGAASGAMMASMIAPMFGPAAPLVIGVGGLIGAVQGMKSANEENTKALKEQADARLNAQTQSAMQGFANITQAKELSQKIGSTSAKSSDLQNIGLTTGASVLEGFSKISNIFKGAAEAPTFSSLTKKQKESLSPEVQAYMESVSRGDLGSRYYTESQIKADDPNVVSKLGYFKDDVGVAKSRKYQSETKEIVGFGKQKVASAKNIQGSLIDYLMKNEKSKLFSFDFGKQDGAAANTVIENLTKEEYAKVLKGQEVRGGLRADTTLIQQELGDKLKKIYNDYEVKAGEQRDALILQLNFQRVMLKSQKAAADAQLDIKTKYLKQSNLLDSQEKMLGGLMSEEQKVRIQYNKNLTKASEAYASGAAKAKSDFSMGLLQDIQGQGKDSLRSAIKQELFKRMSDREKSGKDAGGITNIKLSEKLAEMSSKEKEDLLTSLKSRNPGVENEINEILGNRQLIYDNQINTLGKQKTLSDGQSLSQKNLNEKIAKQKDLMVDVNREMQDYIRGLDNAAQSRAIASEITAARFGARPQTQGAIFTEQGRLTEERKKTIRTDYAKSATSQIKKLADDMGLTEEQIKQVIQKPSLLKGMPSKPISSMEEDLGSLQFSAFAEEKGSDKHKSLLEQIEELEQSIASAKSETAKKSDRITKILQGDLKITKEKLSKEDKLLEIRKDEYTRRTGPDAFGEGIKDAGIEMEKRVAMMDYELAKNIPMKFADGLAQAMQATLNQTENLGDALMGIASNFLQAIQSALLQKAAYQIVGGVGASTGLFSKGGGVRNYSRGGGVPAMVTNGEYVMSGDAVSKYGGAFMHSLNAGGKIPGYANGGAAPGSAIAENFGGGRGFASGRAYQSKAMSSFFYTQSQNVGLKEDEQSLMGVLREEERKRQEAAAKKAKKKQFIQQLIGTALSAGLTAGLTNAIKGGDLTKSAISKGYTDAAPKGALSGFNTKTGMRASFAPGSEIGGNWITQPVRQSAFSKYNPFNWGMKPQQGPGFASGGHVSGKSGIDQIPAMLSEGEYVIKASSARQLGKPMLDRINAGKYNDGGAVGSTQIDSSTSAGNTNNISISINMENGKVSAEEKTQDTNPATSQEGSSEKDQSLLAEKIKQQVVSVIVEEQRPGGLLSE